jgi:glc operon protein GlcG
VILSESLGWSEAEQGIAAAIAATGENGRRMAFAIVDSHGDLVAAARMDGCHSRVLTHAIRKARTAAIYERNTLALKRQMRDSDRELLEWGDLGVTTLQGGLVVRAQDGVVGGVGVGGGTLAVDEEVARIVVRAMGFEPVEDEQR